MSEQKYYVKLIQEVFISDKCGHGGIICHTWLSKDYYFSEELFRQAFTKSELSEIMDGALYRKPFLGETGIQPEWINPLIELVPVEEVEDD